jgi:hypothetical protein
MHLLRQLALPIGLLVVFIALVGIGFASAQTGLVALSLFCVWPFFWGAAAWSVRGLKDTYTVVPKEKARSQRSNRTNEVLG